MTLLLIVLSILLLPIIVAAVALLVTGASLIWVFSDVIVAGLIIWWIVRFIRRRM